MTEADWLSEAEKEALIKRFSGQTFPSPEQITVPTEEIVLPEDSLSEYLEKQTTLISRLKQHGIDYSHFSDRLYVNSDGVETNIYCDDESIPPGTEFVQFILSHGSETANLAREVGIVTHSQVRIGAHTDLLTANQIEPYLALHKEEPFVEETIYLIGTDFTGTPSGKKIVALPASFEDNHPEITKLPDRYVQSPFTNVDPNFINQTLDFFLLQTRA